MYGMFAWDSALTYANLSNFNTRNVTTMKFMFFRCTSLKKENVIIRDEKLLNQYSSLCIIF